MIVCGGGLAGIGAAVEAALCGARVTLLERRPFLGGKAFSFDLDGTEIDNGQHVFLGCCTAYQWLLGQLGALADVTLPSRLRVVVRDRAGTTGVLAASRLPAPLHIGPSFARFPLLSGVEKARAVRALTTLMLLRDADRLALDDVSFGDWLGDHGQRAGAIERFWDLIVLPTCNDRSDRVSAALAAYVFREGLFRTRGGSAIGRSRVGLTTLVDARTRRFVEGKGGTVRTGTSVVQAESGSVVLGDGSRLTGDAVILALPAAKAATVAPSAVDPTPDLGSSPILNLHLWFDRKIMAEDFIAVVDSPAQWIFGHQGAASGQRLVVSVSGARAEIAQSKTTLIETFVDEIRVLFPGAAHARLERAHVVKEPDATFAAAPGQARARPNSQTRDPSVFLAGSWTNTGWPATMEGAVRSGILAARLSLRDRLT